MRLATALAMGFFTLAFVGIATAADDPIAERQAVMKMNGKAAGEAFKMTKGQVPWDATKAAADMQSLQDDMVKFVTLFPPGSDKGKTQALPAIWDNMDDFKAKAAQLAADAKVAQAAAAQGQDAFTAAFGAVGNDCQACHEKYRQPS